MTHMDVGNAAGRMERLLSGDRPQIASKLAPTKADMGWLSRIVTNLARAFDVVHATAANFRVRWIDANIFTVVPAAAALCVFGLDYLELQASHLDRKTHV